MQPVRSRLTHRGLPAATALLLAALAVQACGTKDPTTTAGTQGAAAHATAQNIVAGVTKDDALAVRLPPAVKNSGKLAIGNNVKAGRPPFQFLGDDNKTPRGVEIDLRDAIARELGLQVESTDGAWTSILPGLSAGKYEVAQGNFGVTEERKKVYDFVTYYTDGFGFVVKKGSTLPAVTKLTDLCGLKIGTGAGTSFVTVLQTRAGDCAKLGKKPWAVATYSDTSGLLLGLEQGHDDVDVSTAIGLQYQVSLQPDKIAFDGKIYTENVGFVVKKGDPLAPVLQKAVQKLIDSGAYGRILAAWGLQGAAIPTSQINPPGLQ